MAQRTGRKVSSDVAHLPERAAPAKGSVGVPMPERIGDGSPTDASAGNDGSKGAASAPKGAHKGPDRTK
jgi:hypothetical protein